MPKSKHRHAAYVAILATAALLVALLQPYAASARPETGTNQATTSASGITAGSAKTGTSARAAGLHAVTKKPRPKAKAHTKRGAHKHPAKRAKKHVRKPVKKVKKNKASNPNIRKICRRVVKRVHGRKVKRRVCRIVRAPVQTDPRPNIVVVMMDDMRWDELPYAPTVNSMITDRGMSFANSYSPFPLCCPARASFLLGKYAHNHGVISTDYPYGFGSLDDSRTVATGLQAAGYQTAMVGKYLNGYGVMPSKVNGQTTTYVPPGWTDWMGSLDTNTHESADPNAYQGGTYNYLTFRQNINGVPTVRRNYYSSDRIADETVDLVGKYHWTPKPFFLWLTPVAPHHGLPRDPTDPDLSVRSDGTTMSFPSPYVPVRYRGMFNSWISHAPGIPLWRGTEDDVSDKPDYIRNLPDFSDYEKAAILEVERQRVASIYAWDQQFARVVAALKANGEYDNTVFMFTSDNGYYLGEHRLGLGKINPHEPSIRVPLVVAGPGVARGTSYDPAITEDLPATILDLANAAPLPGEDGQSLVPELRGQERGWNRAIDIEGYFWFRPVDPEIPAGLSHSGIRTGRYKYIHYSNGDEELYDLATDPNELESLDKDPAYADLKAELVALWKKQRACEGAQCSAPLPADLDVGTQRLRELAFTFNDARDQYYNR